MCLRFGLTIYHQLFRKWLGADQATSQHLNQWPLFHWRIYASHGLNDLSRYPVLNVDLLACSGARICEQLYTIQMDSSDLTRVSGKLFRNDVKHNALFSWPDCVTGCPCGVWCRGFPSLYVSQMFGHLLGQSTRRRRKMRKSFPCHNANMDNLRHNMWWHQTKLFAYGNFSFTTAFIKYTWGIHFSYFLILYLQHFGISLMTDCSDHNQNCKLTD